MTIQQDAQKPGLKALVELYTFDLSALAGPVFRVTPNVGPTGLAVSYGGAIYTPLPIKGDGWQRTVDGASPRPVLKLANITRFIQPILTNYGQCVGATVTRVVTTEDYLDTGATPDGSQALTVDVYTVNQCTKLNRFEVEFKLMSPLDVPTKMFPPRQVLRAEFPGAGLFRKR